LAKESELGEMRGRLQSVEDQIYRAMSGAFDESTQAALRDVNRDLRGD
jgi:hypothetical protein